MVSDAPVAMPTAHDGDTAESESPLGISDVETSSTREKISVFLCPPKNGIWEEWDWG